MEEERMDIDKMERSRFTDSKNHLYFLNGLDKDKELFGETDLYVDTEEDKEVRISKYMSLENTLNLLEKEELYLANPSVWSDPFESLFIKAKYKINEQEKRFNDLLPDNKYYTSKITKIPVRAFDGCSSLQSIELPEGLTSIEHNAFADSGLSEVSFPSTLESIFGGAFSSTNIKSIVLPDSLTTLRGFRYCTKLTSIVIPPKITRIYTYDFENCTNLETVTIKGDSINLDNDAFTRCTNLKSLYCYATKPAVCSGSAFEEMTFNTCTLYVPQELLATYKAKPDWNKFKRIESITSDETPDTEEQKAEITDATTEMPAGTYEAGNLIYSRTVSNFKQGMYATLCLPFSINLAEAECFSDVYIPNEIALYNPTTKKLTLMMSKASKTGVISAGQPFMAKLSNSTISLKNYNRTYLRSTAAEDLKSNMAKKFKVYDYDGTSTVLLSNDDIDVRFCGTFSKMINLNKDNYKTFSTTGMFYQDTTVNPFRAYIYKATTTAANSLQSLTVGSDAVTDAILQGNFTIKRNQLIINK